MRSVSAVATDVGNAAQKALTHPNPSHGLDTHAQRDADRSPPPAITTRTLQSAGSGPGSLMPRRPSSNLASGGAPGMQRANSQRSGGGAPQSGMQFQLQEEPTISAWDTDQDGWEKDSHGRRDEIKLYMADRSMQARASHGHGQRLHTPGKAGHASDNSMSNAVPQRLHSGTTAASRQPANHDLKGSGSGHPNLSASGTSVAKLGIAKLGSIGPPDLLTPASAALPEASKPPAPAAATTNAEPPPVPTRPPPPKVPAVVPPADPHLSESDDPTSQTAPPSSSTPSQPSPAVHALQHQPSFNRMPSLSESPDGVLLDLSSLQGPGFVNSHLGALPSSTPIIRSASMARRSRLSSSSMHRAPDSPRHEAMNAASRIAEEALVADRVLRSGVSGTAAGLLGPADPTAQASSASLSLHPQASYDSSNDDAGSAKSYIDLLDADEIEDGGTYSLTAIPSQLSSRYHFGSPSVHVATEPENGDSSVLMLCPAEPGWQQLSERGVGINGQTIRASAGSMRGSSSRQHLTARDTCPQGNETPVNGTARTSSSPIRLDTAQQHRRRAVFHSVPISLDASLAVSNTANKGYPATATLLGPSTAPLPLPLLTNLTTQSQSVMAELIQQYQYHPMMAAAMARGGLPVRPHTQPATYTVWQEGDEIHRHQSQQPPQQQQLQFNPPTIPTTGIASISGLMRLSFSRGGVRQHYQQQHAASSRGTGSSVPCAIHTTASALQAAGIFSSPSKQTEGATTPEGPDLDELSAAHSRLPRSPNYNEAENSGSYVSHIQHRWGGQLLAYLGGTATSGVQRPATSPTPGRHRDPYLTAKSCSHYSLSQMEQRPLTDLPPSSRWLSTAITPPPSVPTVPVSISTIPSAMVLARPVLKQPAHPFPAPATVPVIPSSTTPTGSGHVRANLLVYPLSAPDFLQAIPTAPTYAQPTPNYFPGNGSSTRSARFQAPFAARKLRLPSCGPSGTSHASTPVPGLENLFTRNSHPQVRVDAEAYATMFVPSGSRSCRGLGKAGKSRQHGGAEVPLRLSAAWQGSERDSAVVVSSIAATRPVVSL